jgi:hypothetical protein
VSGSFVGDAGDVEKQELFVDHRSRAPAARAWPLGRGRRDAAIAAMRAAAARDDASEKTVAMENKPVPIRVLLGELCLAAGRNREALAEFEASQRIWRIVSAHWPPKA